MRSFRNAPATRTVLLTASFLLTTSVLAADIGKSGFATSDNFTILAPRHATAEQANDYASEVLEAAESLRSEIAQEWLGHELPRRQGRTIVTVSFERHRDAGLTWAIDDPRRSYHNLYLSTSPQQALGSTLAHEMVHVVLATAYPHPDRLPTWLEEGIASRYDDAGRHHQRQRHVSTYIRTNRWPRVARVLGTTRMHASDEEAYTVATSVTAMLLALDDDRQKLLAFGRAGQNNGWDQALREFYHIDSVDELQGMWQRWARADAGPRWEIQNSKSKIQNKHQIQNSKSQTRGVGRESCRGTHEPLACGERGTGAEELGNTELGNTELGNTDRH